MYGEEADMASRVLIVDDEINLVYVMRQALMLTFPGCEVDMAHSGEEGLSRLADRSYDLIIADFRMPGFSGLDLIKGVRYLDGTVPIILITGYGSPEIQAEAEELSVNEYMEKPFDVDRMLSTVGRLLKRPEPDND
jgi:DNA-binding NtrC family response regulator